MGRGDSDEAYVLALCDEVLGEQGSRWHRFDWLFGDAGASGRWVRLPVDSFLVVIEPAELACDGRGRLRRVRDCDLHVITVWVSLTLTLRFPRPEALFFVYMRLITSRS
jgi:hypothetical protein